MRAHLFITPYFPPLSDSGTKRSVHLVRNLPAFGWRPVVLASRAVNEPEDVSLLDAIPRDTLVSYGYSGALRPMIKRLGQAVGPLPLRKRERERERERNAQRGRLRLRSRSRSRSREGAKPARDWTFLTPFDRFIADTPAGIRAGLRLIREHDLRAIHVSADPMSGLLAGHLLHAITGLPLISDLRDPWSQHQGKLALYPALSRRWLLHYEAQLFRASARVVLNTEACREAYVEAYRGRIPESRFVCIRNAFDEGLFHPGRPERREGFTLLYFGRFRKFVGPEMLLQALARFVRREDLRPGQARLLVVGGVEADLMPRAEALGVAGFVETRPAVPFRDSLPVLASADALALVVEPACELQIPGKLYDYLAARRPVLAISANREVDRLVEDGGAGLAAPYGDPDAAAEKLATLYREAQRGAPRRIAAEALEGFSARAQARRLARVLDKAVGG